MRIFSWNVNSLRSLLKVAPWCTEQPSPSFLSLFNSFQADIICLQVSCPSWRHFILQWRYRVTRLTLVMMPSLSLVVLLQTFWHNMSAMCLCTSLASSLLFLLCFALSLCVCPPLLHCVCPSPSSLLSSLFLLLSGYFFSSSVPGCFSSLIFLSRHPSISLSLFLLLFLFFSLS